MLFRLGTGIAPLFGRLNKIVTGFFKINATDAHLINGSGDKLIIQHKE